ncbi:hypothetical protein EfmAA242_11650 [Enterococcus faecium]|nr:hypothetical protein EfmAA242_11650 [Enterococcus faecium]
MNTYPAEQKKRKLAKDKLMNRTPDATWRLAALYSFHFLFSYNQRRYDFHMKKIKSGEKNET